MWCWYYRRQIDDLLGGVLPARRETALRRHLRRCPRCAELWNCHGQVRSLLRSWSAPSLGPYVRRRVMAAIEADPLSREYRHFSPLWWRRLFVECAVGAVLVLAALHLFSWGIETSGAGSGGVAAIPAETCLAETYLVELMSDPRTAQLSDGERYMLLGALVTPSVGVHGAGERPSRKGP